MLNILRLHAFRDRLLIEEAPVSESITRPVPAATDFLTPAQLFVQRAVRQLNDKQHNGAVICVRRRRGEDPPKTILLMPIRAGVVRQEKWDQDAEFAQRKCDTLAGNRCIVTTYDVRDEKLEIYGGGVTTPNFDIAVSGFWPDSYDEAVALTMAVHLQEMTPEAALAIAEKHGYKDVFARLFESSDTACSND